MSSWKEESWRGRLKLVLFSLVPVTLLLVIAQSCAYVALHRTISMTTNPVTEQTYYSMQIGKWPGSHKSLTPINSLGLPDAEFVNVLPKGGCIHVLFAGDSFTFGDATSAPFRWTNVVQGMTARWLPNRCIRFFNIGVRNTTIDTTLVRIRQVWPLIEPDVVILEQYQNDLTDLSNPGSPAWVPFGHGRTEDSHWGTRLAKSVPGYNISLLRLLTYQAFAWMIRNNIRYDVLGTWSVLEGESKREYATKLKTIYHDLYGSLVRDMRARDVQLGVVIFPSKQDVLAKRSLETEYFVGLAREFDVPYLSLMPTLDANRRAMPFYVYDGHMNELGNEVSAEAIWQWLFTSQPAPIPLLGRLANTSVIKSSAHGTS